MEDNKNKYAPLKAAWLRLVEFLRSYLFNSQLVWVAAVSIWLLTAFLYIDLLTNDASYRGVIGGMFVGFAITFFIAYFMGQMFTRHLSLQIVCILTTVTLIPLFIVLFAYCYLDGQVCFQGNCVLNNPHDALYFSVVTFTSLGYGDYHPMGRMRLFASVEVLTGIILTPALIAQLLVFARRYGDMVQKIGLSMPFTQTKD